MIEGFKLKVASAEIKKHLIERSDYHKRRATEKTAELPGLKEALDRIKAHGNPATIATMNKTSSYAFNENAVESLERDIKDHRNKSLVFAFYAEHLFDEDYVLDEDDLRRLEILR